jgi:hypothetical protein
MMKPPMKPPMPMEDEMEGMAPEMAPEMEPESEYTGQGPNLFATYEQNLSDIPDLDMFAELYENPVIANAAVPQHEEQPWEFYDPYDAQPLSGRGSPASPAREESGTEMADMLARDMSDRKDRSNLFQANVTKLNKSFNKGGY